MPQSIWVAAWIVMAVGYSFSGYTKLVSPSWLNGTALVRVLENPLARPSLIREWMLQAPAGFWSIATWGALVVELLFAPLALVRAIRPWLWIAMLSMHLGLMVLIDFADLSFGMVVLHLFTFNPAWIKPLSAAQTDHLFYDGKCGLCHRAVRFVLAEDGSTKAFRFAPIDGEAFREFISEPAHASLPDSIVVLTRSKRVLTRSAAVLYIGKRLGGYWRVLATLAGFLPGSLLDRLYDAIARVRYRLFRPPAEACPLFPAHIRARFDA